MMFLAAKGIQRDISFEGDTLLVSNWSATSILRAGSICGWHLKSKDLAAAPTITHLDSRLLVVTQTLR